MAPLQGRRRSGNSSFATGTPDLVGPPCILLSPSSPLMAQVQSRGDRAQPHTYKGTPATPPVQVHCDSPHQAPCVFHCVHIDAISLHCAAPATRMCTYRHVHMCLHRCSRASPAKRAAALLFRSPDSPTRQSLQGREPKCDPCWSRTLLSTVK